MIKRKKFVYGQSPTTEEPQRTWKSDVLGTNVTGALGLESLNKENTAEAFLRGSESAKQGSMASTVAGGMQAVGSMLQPDEPNWKQKLANLGSKALLVQAATQGLASIPAVGKHMSGLTGSVSEAEAERHASQILDDVKHSENNAYSKFGIEDTVLGRATAGNKAHKNLEKSILEDAISREAEHFTSSDPFKRKYHTPDGVEISTEPESFESVNKIKGALFSGIDQDYQEVENDIRGKYFNDAKSRVAMKQGGVSTIGALAEGEKFSPNPDDSAFLKKHMEDVRRESLEDPSASSLVRRIRTFNQLSRDYERAGNTGLSNVYKKAVRQTRETLDKLDPKTGQALREIDSGYATAKEFEEADKETTPGMDVIKKFSKPYLMQKLEKMLIARGGQAGDAQKLLNVVKMTEARRILEMIKGSPQSIPQAMTRLMNLQKLAPNDPHINALLSHFSQFKKMGAMDNTNGNLGNIGRMANAHLMSNITGGGIAPWLYQSVGHQYPSTYSRGINALLRRNANVSDVSKLGKQGSSGLIGDLLKGLYRSYSS